VLQPVECLTERSRPWRAATQAPDLLSDIHVLSNVLNQTPEVLRDLGALFGGQLIDHGQLGPVEDAAQAPDGVRYGIFGHAGLWIPDHAITGSLQCRNEFSKRAHGTPELGYPKQVCS
jgi:hypothetical protein